MVPRLFARHVSTCYYTTFFFELLKISLTFGVASVGDAVAGEKVKLRLACYMVKFDQVAVGDEEGHLVAVSEAKGISTNLQGGKFLDGWPYREAGLSDANRNIGTCNGCSPVCFL